MSLLDALRPAFPRWGLPVLLLAAGCASRDVPARYPATSAASPKGAAGPVLHVTKSLEGDPTGGDYEKPDAGSENPHAHHGGHHHGH